jgi:transposase InsO family protein
VAQQCGFSRSQLHEWHRGVRPRKPRETKTIREETAEQAVDVMMSYPHFSGRKGQAYMLYHRLGYVSMNGYDQLKKSVKRLVSQEVSNRGLLPRRTRYEHVKPQKVGQIWAEDFTELTVYGERFKFGVLIDVADQYYLGSCVEKRANVALVDKPVQQALAANGGKGPGQFLLSDNGSVYVSDHHGNLLDKADIVHKRIPACRPQYNGAVECGIKEFKNVFYNVWARREPEEADKEKRHLLLRVRQAAREAVILLNEEIPRPSLGGVTPADVHHGLGPDKIQANQSYREQELDKPDPPAWTRSYWEVVKEAMGLETRTGLEMLIKFCFFWPRPLRKIAKLAMDV